MGVVNNSVKAAPSVTGVGEVRLVTVPVVSPMLFRIMVVTVSGGPDVMVVAVEMSLVGADAKVPFGTKLKATWIGIAQAGEALTAAMAIIRGNPNLLIFVSFELGYRMSWKPWQGPCQSAPLNKCHIYPYLIGLVEVSQTLGVRISDSFFGRSVTRL